MTSNMLVHYARRRTQVENNQCGPGTAHGLDGLGRGAPQGTQIAASLKRITLKRKMRQGLEMSR